ncbi:hypothetical protein YC2023_051861 [Brassica napus]
MTVERHAYVIRKTTVLDVVRRLLQPKIVMVSSYARKQRSYQYDKLRKKQAFLDNYRKFPMFADNDLSEFDEARDIIESLVYEYKACESPDYIKWGRELLTGEGNASGVVDPKLAF